MGRHKIDHPPNPTGADPLNVAGTGNQSTPVLLSVSRSAYAWGSAGSQPEHEVGTMAKDDPWMIVESVSAGWNLKVQSAGTTPVSPVVVVPSPGDRPKPILTVDELIERWSVSRETIFDRVDDPQNPLPILILSGKKKGKNRTLVRFRLVAVEAWEASIERRAIQPHEPGYEPPGRPIGYTGKIHTRTPNLPRAKKAAAKK